MGLDLVIQMVRRHDGFRTHAPRGLAQKVVARLACRGGKVADAFAAMPTQGPVRQAVGAAEAFDRLRLFGGPGPKAMIDGHHMDGGVGQMRASHCGKMQERGGVRAARHGQNQPGRTRGMGCGGKERRGLARADRTVVA